MRINSKVAYLMALALPHALTFSLSADAAEFYVALHGSDDDPGSEEKPWRTIAHAVNTMAEGDTTYVKEGSYADHVRFSRPGTAPAPIKLLNYPGHSAVIDCQDVGTRSVLIQHAGGKHLAMGHITIEGLEITNCHDGIKFYNLHDSTIRGNRIHHNNNQAIVGSGTRNLIDRNAIHSNGNQAQCDMDPSWCTQEHGIYANGTAFTVTNNIIYDNLGNGIQLNGSVSYDSAKYAGPEYAASHNWIIANNTFAYQRYGAGIVVWSANCDNARIENNLFYENGVNGSTGHTQGIHFLNAMNSLGVTIKNNHFYASGSGRQVALTATGQPDNLVTSESVINVSPPAFVNGPASLPASPNFALTEQSPAVDAGLALPEVKTDYLGAPRPYGASHDIGAYEYGAMADGSPAPPTGLSVN